jgi:hypothetical protein
MLESCAVGRSLKATLKKSVLLRHMDVPSTKQSRKQLIFGSASESISGSRPLNTSRMDWFSVALRALEF